VVHHVREHRDCGLELLLRFDVHGPEARELVERDRLLPILLGPRDGADERERRRDVDADGHERVEIGGVELRAPSFVLHADHADDVIAVPERGDDRIADRRIAPGEPFVAGDRPAQQQRLPGPGDIAGDPLADLLAVPSRFIRETDRAAHGERAVVDEHDGHAVRAEHTGEAGRRALEEGLWIALRAHELLQLA